MIMTLYCLNCGNKLNKKGNIKYCVKCRPEINRIRHNKICAKYRKKHKKTLIRVCIYCKTKFEVNSNVQLYCDDCIKKRRRHQSHDKKRLYKHPEKNLWHNAKKRAKRKNLPFEIKITDLKLPKLCPVLGIPLYIDPPKKKGDGRGGHGYSIDKIDNNKGYTKDNICIISDRANRLKSDGTLEEFKKIVKYIEKYS